MCDAYGCRAFVEVLSEDGSVCATIDRSGRRHSTVELRRRAVLELAVETEEVLPVGGDGDAYGAVGVRWCDAHDARRRDEAGDDDGRVEHTDRLGGETLKGGRERRKQHRGG